MTFASLVTLGKAGYFLVSLAHCTLFSSGESYKAGSLDMRLKSFKQPQQLGTNSMALSSLSYLKCTMKITIPFFLWLLFFLFFLPLSPPSLGAFPFICFVFSLAYGQKVIVSIHVVLRRSLLTKYFCITNYSKISWLKTTNIIGECF